MFSSDIPLGDLDKAQGMHMKEKMNLPMSFPNIVLFGPTEAGGCGVERISDGNQESKLNLIKRLQGGDQATQLTIEGILERQSREEVRGGGMERQLRDGSGKIWVSSLIRYLEEGELTLRSRPKLQVGILEEGVRDIEVGDMLIIGEDNSRWVLEVRGWTKTSIRGNRWESIHALGQIRPGKQVKIRRMGRATIDQEAAENAIFRIHGTRRITGGKVTLHSDRIEEVRGRIREVSMHNQWEDDLALPELGEGEYIIATDGSWNENKNGPFEEQRQVSTGLAVVIIKKGEPEPIWGIQVKDMYTEASARAFTQEMVAAVIGTWVESKLNRRISIHTDCKAMVSLARQYKPKHGHSHGVWFDELDKWDTRNLHWVESHTDSKAGPRSFIEAGNILADRAADCGPVHKVSLIDKEVIIQAIIEHSRGWVVCDRKGRVNVEDVNVIGKRRMENYLRARGEEKNRGVEWCIESLKLAIGTEKGMTTRGSLIKLAMARFDIDRRIREAKVSGSGAERCDCQRECDNTVHDWTGTCDDEETVAIWGKAMEDMKKVLAGEIYLRAKIMELAQGDEREQVWRGNWQQWHKEEIREIGNVGSAKTTEKRWKEWTTLLATTTRIFTAATLKMQGIRSKKKKDKEREEMKEERSTTEVGT